MEPPEGGAGDRSGWADASNAGARSHGPGRPPTATPEILRVALVTALVLGLAVVFGIRELRERQAEARALPPHSGSVVATGLGASLTIRRDERGVPHVEAESDADAWFGLGFVHAQDRLAQMLWLRRLARGTVSEWVGPEALAWDRLARTIDFAGLAASQSEALDVRARAVLERYAAGVDARLARIQSGEVAPPLALRSAVRGPTPSIDPWTTADSLAVLSLVSFQSGAPLAGPLVLEDLVQRLGGGGARVFAPTPEVGGGLGVASVLPEFEVEVDPPVRGALLRDGGLGREATIFGGRALAVAAEHTASGAPLVAASYVLSPRVPSLFHQSHVRGGRLDAAGVGIAGVPLYLTGRNPSVAWAISPAPVLGLDLYRETLRGSDEELRYNDGLRWLEVERRDETIRVRGEPDQRVSVRSTRHGTLIQPLLSEPREPLAISWVGSRARNAFGPLAALASTSDVEGALILLRAYDGPPIRALAADVESRVEARLVGWLPRRRLPTGMSPVPGRTRHFDWRDRLDPYDLFPLGSSASPKAKAPSRPEPPRSLGKGKKKRRRGPSPKLDARDFLLVADEIPKAENGPTIEWLWQRGEEQRRLERMLQQAVARGDVDLRDVASVQRDRSVPGGRRFVAAALELAGERARERATVAEVMDLLEQWDGNAGAKSRGAAVYHIFLDQLVTQLFERPLGAALLERYRGLRHARIEAVARDLVMRSAAADLRGGWLDRQNARRAVLEALRRTWAALGNRLGPNRSHWQWGRLHRLRFEPFVSASGLRGPAGLRERGVGGGLSTLHAAGYDGSGTFEVDRASTVLVGIDLGAADQLTTTLAPGQTEHPSDPYFAHGIDAWADGRPTLVLTSRLLVDAGEGVQLRLEPAPQ